MAKEENDEEALEAISNDIESLRKSVRESELKMIAWQ
jgi:hypothetical protein